MARGLREVETSDVAKRLPLGAFGTGQRWSTAKCATTKRLTAMIRDDIKTAIVTAMKGGDKDTDGTLRLVQAAIKNRDIELRTGTAPADDDALVTEVLQKMIKQRRESADLYRKGGREDLRRARGSRDRGDRALPPRAVVRRRSQRRDRRDRRRTRRVVDEGHGPGHGAGEGAPRHRIEPARASAWSRVRWRASLCARPAMTLSPAFLDELRARDHAVQRHRAARQAHPRRARMEGLLPVPQRKDAQLHRQRRQAFLPLLRLRRAWRRDPLPDRQSRPAVHGRGQGTRRQGRDGSPRPRPAAAQRAERQATLHDVMAAAQAWFAEQLDGDRGRRGARLSASAAASTPARSSGSASASRPTAAGPAQGARCPHSARQADRRPAC